MNERESTEREEDVIYVNVDPDSLALMDAVASATHQTLESLLLGAALRKAHEVLGEPTGSGMPGANGALIAEIRALGVALQQIVETQQRHNPRWFETPAAAIVVATLSLVIALLAFIGDRVDASEDQPTTPPAVVAPPAVSDQVGPVPR